MHPEARKPEAHVIANGTRSQSKPKNALDGLDSRLSVFAEGVWAEKTSALFTASVRPVARMSTGRLDDELRWSGVDRVTMHRGR